MTKRAQAVRAAASYNLGSAQFRNTHFSYQIRLDGIETFAVTPEVQSNDTIGTDPLAPEQVWPISLGGRDEGAGLTALTGTKSQ